VKSGFCVLLVLLECVAVWAQKADSCAAINAAKAKTYGFQPSHLLDKQRQSKSLQMDAFWRLVGEDKQVGVPCLSQLLGAEKQDGFFLFDGASLLYSLDQSEAPTRLVIDSLRRADMAEIEPSGYLRLLLRMSNAGVDIGPLAQRYLEYPKVDTYVPQHAMDLDRDMGALLLYGSMVPEKEDKYLIAALHDKEGYARATAALLLALNMTEESLKALNTFSGWTDVPEDSKKVIQSYRTHTAYQAPAAPVKFSREEVLTYIAQLPHTDEEFRAAMQRQEEYEKQHPELAPNGKLPDKELEAAVTRKVQESPPFFGVAGADRFIESAVANLTEADLPVIREARRKAMRSISDEALGEYFAYSHIIRGVVNRLDLYREYRVH
jgi:hypothetical protein